MSLTLIVPAVEDRPEPTPVREPSSTLDVSDLSILREPFESLPAIVAAVRSEPPPHRRQAAAMVRDLGGRTEAALRRELDRFFATRSGLSHADQVAIARAMSRFRNQLLHHPRSTLRAAAATEDTAGANPLLDVVRRLFGLADAHHSDRAELRTPASRPTRASTSSAT
jgi:hypothetical protein